MTMSGRRVPRRRAFLALLIFVCGVALTAPAGALANGPCKGGNLHLSVHSHDRNSHSTSWVLAFRNSDDRCVLDGYPRTELLNRHGQSKFPGLVTHKLHVLYGEVVLDRNKAAYVSFSLFHGPACHAPSHSIYSIEFLGSRNLRLQLGKTSMCYVQVSPFRNTA
jgi:hypothetical protein